MTQGNNNPSQKTDRLIYKKGEIHAAQIIRRI